MALRNINCKNQQIKLQITGFSTSFYKYDTFNICFTSSARGKSWELSWIVWFYPHPLSHFQSVLVSTNNVKWDCLTESCSSSWSCHHGCFSQYSKPFPKSLKNYVCLYLHPLSKLDVWALLLSSLMDTPIGDSFLGLYHVSVSEERIFLSTVWIGSPAQPHHTTLSIYCIFSNWNHSEPLFEIML